MNVPCEILWEIDIEGNFKITVKSSKIYVYECIYMYNFKPLKLLILQK